MPRTVGKYRKKTPWLESAGELVFEVYRECHVVGEYRERKKVRRCKPLPSNV
jgi:hypothetical protein